MIARIFKPGKTAMQSGKAKTDEWILEFYSAEEKKIDPLMGWTGSGDTQSQVKLKFLSKDTIGNGYYIRSYNPFMNMNSELSNEFREWVDYNFERMSFSTRSVKLKL